jgi:cytoskeleton protein RodZ
MTEADAGRTAGQGAASAGAMLRAAREKQGMHIAMLAAMIKVTPKKLESLETGRLDELPDLAFARALAQSVCRTLKLDPQPVLAQLPQLAKPEGLERAANGLNTPYQHADAPSMDTGEAWALWRRPAFWATAAVLMGALGMVFAPQTWLERLNVSWLKRSAQESAASGQPRTVTETLTPTPKATAPALASSSATAATQVPAGPVAAAMADPSKATAVADKSGDKTLAAMGPARPEPTAVPVVETVHSAPSAAAMPEGSSAALVVRATQPAWVEITDGKGESLIKRSVQKDETVNIAGTPPYRVRLGNVQGTELRYKGEPVDIRSKSVGNVVRFELN